MKRNGSLWPKVLVGVVGVCATLWILVVSLGASATREWERYAASLRAKGQPLTFEEIEAQRAVVPEEKNSARVIEELANSLEQMSGGGVTLDSITPGSKDMGDFFTGIRKDRIEPARKFLDDRRELLAKLDEIRDKPTGRFTIQYNKDNPIATLVPYLPETRAASKLFRAHASVQLIDANLAGALNSFELQSRLVGTLHDEPMLISRLVQVAITAAAVQTTEDILRTGTPDSAALDRMSAELTHMRQAGTLQWGLLGERAFFIETCEAMLAGRVPLAEVQSPADVPSGLFALTSWRHLPAFVARANQLTGAKMHTSLIEAADDPAAMLAAAQKNDVAVSNLSRFDTLVKIMMPSLSRAVVVNTKSAAQLDCAIAALAAERFRLAKGRLPDALGELVPAYLPSIPIDPFDGKPIRLAKKPEGIVIYSVDEDRIDDGGEVAKPTEPKKKRAPDVGFRLNDPDHRGVLIVEGLADSED